MTRGPWFIEQEQAEEIALSRHGYVLNDHNLSPCGFGFSPKLRSTLAKRIERRETKSNAREKGKKM